MFLTPRSSAGTMRFVINNGSGEQVLETTALPTLRWQHVAVTLGGGTARLYLNGKQAVALSGFTQTPHDFVPKRNYLGKSQFVADPLFSGRLDEVAVNDSVFTVIDIAMMNAPVIRSYQVASDGSFVVTATAIPSASYALQATDFSAGSTWTTVATATATTTGSLRLVDATPQPTARDYRIITQ